MAELRSVLVPLDGSNYATWKVQCRMALIKEDVWGIVEGTETVPEQTDTNKYSQYIVRKNRALAIIVLAVDPKLLYLLGEPEDPKEVWNKLANQFQKKTWCNKLQLRRRLYALKLREGGSVQDHIKAMTEIFNELNVIGDSMDEEDRVVHLLASLPESYNMLVTALEANSEVPKMEFVTEKLLHEERKSLVKDNDGSLNVKQEKAYYAKESRNIFKCHHCGKTGHIKRNCWFWKSGTRPSSSTEKVNCAEAKQDSCHSDESVGLLAAHAMPACNKNTFADTWIVDSGATCHMCNNKELFIEYGSKETGTVSLGDGHPLETNGSGKVVLKMMLPNGEMKKCTLSDVLYVPKLSFNLLSVSKSSKLGNVVKFYDNECKIFDVQDNLIAVAEKKGDLYILKCTMYDHKVNAVCNMSESKPDENIWHRRYGHLGADNMKLLVKDDLVEGLEYDVSKELKFCEPCVKGKSKKSPFPCTKEKPDREPLDLIHSDVCGKMSEKSLSGGEYFVTFIDDATRYVWVYILKGKHEVFVKFKEWKSLVEKQMSKKIKILRSDNGGEYTSNEFEQFLKDEGIRHECTVPKTPQQNGVSERMNRTLVDQIRAMLIDSGLPHKFWAEALSTACYLKNRSPARALKGVTPYQALMGRKPNVDHLKVFGCLCYAHVPKDERKKLDSKSVTCIFLGYGSEVKGYRLYVLERERIMYSRDVIFDESKCGFQKEKNVVQSEMQSIEILHTNSRASENNDEADQSQSTVRRSARTRQPPDMFGEWVSISQKTNEPTSVSEALMSGDRELWKNAMQEEMNSIHENDVYDLVELPEGRKALNSRWVFKKKTMNDGSAERYKARLVAQGCSQKFGVDYDETFCPVVRFESIRTVLALASQKKMKLHHMDVTTAFLNGALMEEVYMKQPDGFVEQGKKDLVCKLKKSIYGLKQSPRCWNHSLDDFLKNLGFAQTLSDPCIYVKLGEELFIIAVYVDDIILACKSDKKIEEIKNSLASQYKLKDMGELTYFLGVKVIQDSSKGQIWIGQPSYTESILRKFGMEDAKPIETPVDPNQKLCKATDNCTMCDQEQYQSAVGSLLYLSVKTRPDITYAVNTVARYCAKPTILHWKAVKRIMRYLKGTQHFGILYTPDGPNEFVGYSDADWAGDTDERKSTSGYFFQLGSGAVSWSSKRQSCVALSTAEAEYMALANAAQEAVWLRKLSVDMQINCKGPMLLYEDNQSTIAMSKNPQFHGRSKHIDVKFHYIREMCNENVIHLMYCPSDDMLADIFTKGLNKDKFKRLRKMLGMSTN